MVTSYFCDIPKIALVYWAVGSYGVIDWSSQFHPGLVLSIWVYSGDVGRTVNFRWELQTLDGLWIKEIIMTGNKKKTIN